ncbi:hypothetical protein [Methanopyrus kandleri]
MKWARKVFDVCEGGRFVVFKSRSWRGSEKMKVIVRGEDGKSRSLGVFSPEVAERVVEVAKRADGPEGVVAGVIWGTLVALYGVKGARRVVCRMVELAGGEPVEL